MHGLVTALSGLRQETPKPALETAGEGLSRHLERFYPHARALPAVLLALVQQNGSHAAPR